MLKFTVQILWTGNGLKWRLPVLWIRIGFSADLDPALYFITMLIQIWIQGAKSIRIRIRILVRLKSRKKLTFYYVKNKNILKVSNRGKKTTYLRKAQKPF
jgi:hypothetical protein